MKKVYVFFTALCATVFASAQVAVTFQVDMSNETVSANGVHIAGNFQMADGHTSDWDPAATELTDPDQDGIYTYTANIAAGTYEYKFVNGNAWGGDESVPGSCAVNGNREVVVSGAMTIPVVCFALCEACPTATDTMKVTLQVDMSQETVSANGVHVAGSFGAGGYANWTPDGIQLTDNGSGLYEVELTLPQGEYEFKFVNGNAWGADEAVPSECSSNNNRTFTVFGDNDNDSELLTETMTYIAAFGNCPPSDSVDVTIKLDMNGQVICGSGVHVPGDFSAGGYPAWDPSGIELLDDDMDMIYETTVRLPVGNYQHKFVNGNSWAGAEAVPGACNVNGNRELVVEGNGDAFSDILSMDYEICFASCANSCPDVLDPIDVTFRVDMNEEVVEVSGVYVAGTLPCAGWVKDSFEMKDDDSDGIYEFTWEDLPAGVYQFKFLNGDCGDDCEEDGDFITGGCGVDNGVGGSNRSIDLSTATADTVLPIFIYNTCDVTNLSTRGLALSAFKVYPNPATNNVLISYDNNKNLNHTAELMTLTGEVISSESSNSGSIQLNWGDIPAGVYIIQVKNEAGGLSTEKLFVK